MELRGFMEPPKTSEVRQVVELVLLMQLRSNGVCSQIQAVRDWRTLCEEGSTVEVTGQKAP